MPEVHRQRHKLCARCGQPGAVMYRVVRKAAEGWVFLCPPCRSLEAENNPDYRYGGTWKAEKGRGGSG